MASFNLSQPKKKKRVQCPHHAPFPVPVEERDVVGVSPWRVYTGVLSGSVVLVRHSGDMYHLYNMGFFGTGSIKVPQKLPQASQMQGTKERRKYLRHLSSARMGKEMLESVQTVPFIHTLADSAAADDEDDDDDDGDDDTSQPVSANHAGVCVTPVITDTPDMDRQCESTNESVETPASEQNVTHVKANTLSNIVVSETGYDAWETTTAQESEDFWGDAGCGQSGGDWTEASSVSQRDNISNSPEQCDNEAMVCQTDDVNIVCLRDQSTNSAECSQENRDFVMNCDDPSSLENTATPNILTSNTVDNARVTEHSKWVDSQTSQAADSLSESHTTNTCIDSSPLLTKLHDSTDLSETHNNQRETCNNQSETHSNQRDTCNIQSETCDIPDESNDFQMKSRDTEEHKSSHATHMQAGARRKRQREWMSDTCRFHFLQLSLEEAFFLSFGLGCLVVKDGDEAMSINDMWVRFSGLKTQFIPHYIAYHHLRSKGLVPKHGLKFGADFLLYKEGPPFYHASYSVVIHAVSQLSLQPVKRFTNREFSWTTLAALNRVTEQVNKDLMFLYVILPSELNSPICMSQAAVKEVVIRRWISKHERENIHFYEMP